MMTEAEQIETSAMVWSFAYRHRAALFNSFSTCVALLAALVGTAAGGLALSTSSEAGGILALVAAGLAAVSTAVSPSARTQQEQGSAAANTTLADAARVFRTTVVEYGSPEEVAARFACLIDQRDNVVQKAPIEARSTVKKVEKELSELEKRGARPPMSFEPPPDGE